MCINLIIISLLSIFGLWASLVVLAEIVGVFLIVRWSILGWDE